MARPEVVITSLDDETVLSDEQSGQVYLLNESGASVWALCNGQNTVEEIARALAVQYDLDRQRARADVEDLLAQLLDAHLIAVTAIEVV